MTRALLLNASFEPHSVIRDRDAVVMYLEDDAEVLAYSGAEFRSPSTTVLVPSVLRLRKYVVLPNRHRSLDLTTKNVLARDDHTCAYCGKTGLTAGQRGTGTMDHVVPRARGGAHRWENVVASCRPCNARKDDRTLEDLGWKLRREPFRPRGVVAMLAAMDPAEEWLPYLA